MKIPYSRIVSYLTGRSTEVVDLPKEDRNTSFVRRTKCTVRRINGPMASMVRQVQKKSAKKSIMAARTAQSANPYPRTTGNWSGLP